MTTTANILKTSAARDFITGIFLALLSAFVIFATTITVTEPAKAGGAYAQGYAKGKSVGRNHGYQDGFAGRVRSH